MESPKTWLEVALNGPWGKVRQPGIPTSVDEIIEQGVACARAGAAIIQVQAYDEATGQPHDDANLYDRIIRGIRSQADVIVYPAAMLADAAAEKTPADRFAVQEELAKRTLLEWAAVDPGSIDVAFYDDLREDRPGFAYVNPEAHLRYGLSVAARHRAHPSFGIYEPGFARMGATLHWRCSCPAPIYRFMFSSDYTFGFPPDDYGLTAYLNLLDQVAPGAKWMIAGLGADVLPLVPRAVAEGGQVRVGLGDAAFGCAHTNVDLVRAAAEVVGNCGGELATAAEVRAALERVEMGDE